MRRSPQPIISLAQEPACFGGLLVLALELVRTGRFINAERALETKLCQKSYQDDHLEAAAHSYMDEMLTASTRGAPAPATINAVSSYLETNYVTFCKEKDIR
jgi:hypothetical protein